MMQRELECVDLTALLSNSLTIVRERAVAQRITLQLEAGEDLGGAAARGCRPRHHESEVGPERRSHPVSAERTGYADALFVPDN